MLIDAYMPEFDARERHHIRVDAPAERVYEALHSADLASPVVRLLLTLRALPAAVLHGRAGLRRLRAEARSTIRLRDFERQGFSILEENPPNELVIGLEGQFWRPAGGLRSIDRADFASPPSPGLARAAWNFHIKAQAEGGCKLSTETRVCCSDATTRRRFQLYWALVRPGSGLIRHLMLRAVRRTAESPRA